MYVADRVYETEGVCDAEGAYGAERAGGRRGGRLGGRVTGRGP